jgi:hypothetical protein
MALPDVTPEEVAKRYLEGVLLDEFTPEQIQEQIADAIDYLDNRWRAVIESRLASGLLTTRRFTRVISDAVLRVVRNPRGLTSENEGGYGYAQRPDVASGNLWFTADDLESLTGIRPTQAAVPRTVGIALDRGWAP